MLNNNNNNNNNMAKTYFQLVISTTLCGRACVCMCARANLYRPNGKAKIRTHV